MRREKIDRESNRWKKTEEERACREREREIDSKIMDRMKQKDARKKQRDRKREKLERKTEKRERKKEAEYEEKVCIYIYKERGSATDRKREIELEARD